MLFDDDFLLDSDVARDLYHRYAAGQPIIDYHRHLPPEQVATDHRFRSLTAIWLDGDHYKWRAMRTNGVAEDYCTGKKTDWEKFEAWAATVLNNLNPRDNELVATMIGNFQDGSVPGKLQFGSAWWFLDQLDGMEKQIHALSQLGLLARFVGMLTDSRSFLSYWRHEYFRRLLCNILGNDVRRGLLPDDRELLGEMVTDICFRNARGYFGLALQDGVGRTDSAG